MKTLVKRFTNSEGNQVSTVLFTVYPTVSYNNQHVYSDLRWRFMKDME